MANERNKRNPEPNNGNRPIERRVLLTKGRLEERGRKSGPPQAPTGGNVAKQWQRPKNESTPSNRVKKT